MHKKRSHQTRAAKGKGVGIWIPKKKIVNTEENLS